MKLIVDIPEETVNEIKDNAMFAEDIASNIRWNVTGAIVNGIPLPEDMQQFEETTLTVAFAYARYLTMYGVNVTAKWNTATEQSAKLEQAYRKGYYDATEKMMALNRGNENENSD